ncbi:hypothetical protein JWR98_28570, partial [Pseudomonas sp. MAFF 301380]|nr:hypothetical protein [Pseudomonas lactucae]
GSCPELIDTYPSIGWFRTRMFLSAYSSAPSKAGFKLVVETLMVHCYFAISKNRPEPVGVFHSAINDQA